VGSVIDRPQGSPHAWAVVGQIGLALLTDGSWWLVLGSKGVPVAQQAVRLNPVRPGQLALPSKRWKWKRYRRNRQKKVEVLS
jgi:hypothetical protein